MSINSEIIEAIDNNPGFDSDQVVALLSNLHEGSVRAQLSYLRKEKKLDFEASRNSINRPSFKHYPKGYLKSIGKPGSPSEETKPAAKVEEVKPTESVKQEQMKAEVKTPETAKHPFDSIVEQFSEDIMDVLIPIITRHIMDKLPGKLGEALNGKEDSIGRRLITTEAFRRVRKPKVCIVGLLPQQAGIISSEFGIEFDLDFWKDGGSKNLRDLSKTCDYVLAMTNFISHDTISAIKATNGNLRYVSGGMSSLKDELTKLYVEG